MNVGVRHVQSQHRHAHPLAGDAKYGTQQSNKGTGYRFQALCAYRVAFRFTSESAPLEYLNGKEFSLPQPPLCREFEQLP